MAQPEAALNHPSGETTELGAISGEDQVHAICDEPETEDKAPEDDHLVGVRVNPAPEPDQEGLVGLETGVDLDDQVGGRGEDAEKEQRDVALGTGQLGLDDRGSTRGDQAPGLEYGCQGQGEQRS